MGLTAFNSSAFPRVSPWECFSVEWFSVLANDNRLLEGLKNSLVIGFGVVLVAVPLGLAGALMLTQVKERVRPWYYTIVISPILVPGVVLGISTLLFWDRIGVMFGASRESIFYDGYFLTIVGQSTFIAAYTMLVFISRLQRFDNVQEEAALDLGATHTQAFRKILLPFLKPAIGSAAVLAFLASFENYNTTVFTSISTSTLTTVLASKVRYGIDPSISALAISIVILTVLGAAIHEVFKRRQEAEAKQAVLVAAGIQTARKTQRSRVSEPALILILLVFLSGLGTAYFAGTMGVEECKVQVKQLKRAETQKRIEALQRRNAEKRRSQRQSSHKMLWKRLRGRVLKILTVCSRLVIFNPNWKARHQKKIMPCARGRKTLTAFFPAIVCNQASRNNDTTLKHNQQYGNPNYLYRRISQTGIREAAGLVQYSSWSGHRGSD